MAKSEIDRLLANYPGPRDVRYAPQLEGRGSELKNQFPGTYGFLGGLMGTVPDEFERGSVLSDEERARDTAVTRGAEYGYPLGVLANAAPLLSGIGGLAAKYGPGIAKAAAKNAAAPTTLSKQAGVIKAPGGNWLSGSVEDALKGLKRGDYETEAVRALRRVRPNLSIEEARDFIQAAPVDPGDMALNSWIDKQLTRYVKNDMATERDPVRALAERGVLHVDPEQVGINRYKAPYHREIAGYPREGSGQSEAAKAWEAAADSSIGSRPMSDYQNFGPSNLTSEQPWVQNLDPQMKMYNASLSGRTPEALGFNHLIDELRNATNPASGLPADLLLKYDALDKVSVPQAVERVAKINEWRAAQKAEADLARANNAATVLHKEYPEAGMKWVELKSRNPDEFEESIKHLPPAEWQKSIEKFRTENESTLRDALKYEGDTMGHCVGGYCDDVASGASRIYSLRDAKGRPHVTIELKPAEGIDSARFLASKGADPLYGQAYAELGIEPGTDAAVQAAKTVNAMVVKAAKEQGLINDRIIQIKGKGNKKPNDEYLPFVQDFVKSGKWSDVGDIGNAGMQKADWQADTLEEFKRLGIDAPTYGTVDEINKAMNALNKAKGFAKGGAVKTPKAHPCGCDKGYAAGGLVQYDPDRINSLVDQLRAEFA